MEAQLRNQFEAWALGHKFSRKELDHRINGAYLHDDIEIAWQAWLASHKHKCETVCFTRK